MDAEYHVVVTQDFTKAFAAYDSQLVVTPDDAGLLGASGYLHFRLHEFGEAERLYRQAMAADSSVTPIYFGLMESQINQGRLAPARMVLGAFRAHFPDNRFDEWEEIYLAAAAGAYDRPRPTRAVSWPPRRTMPTTAARPSGPSPTSHCCAAASPSRPDSAARR